jgi:hypothetical protein
MPFLWLAPCSHYVLREINQSDNELNWKSSFASIFTQRRILQKAENGRKK